MSTGFRFFFRFVPGLMTTADPAYWSRLSVEFVAARVHAPRPRGGMVYCVAHLVGSSCDPRRTAAHNGRDVQWHEVLRWCGRTLRRVASDLSARTFRQERGDEGGRAVCQNARAAGGFMRCLHLAPPDHLRDLVRRAPALHWLTNVSVKRKFVSVK